MSSSSSPFLNRIAELKKERAALEQFPLDELITIIREVGFTCNRCGLCCTRQFNGHVFLFPEEADKIRAIDPQAIEPPPVFDFCDQQGVLYASGYTIRTHGDKAGTCGFLECVSCRIYGERPIICRIYPYMLHREPDAEGAVDWRQISGLNQHGIYHTNLSLKVAGRIASDVKVFEDRVIAQEIRFLETIERYFQESNLRNIRKCYDHQVQRLRKGGTATVMVFHRGHFEAWNVSQTSAELMADTDLKE
jgi:Fe-S-cluster containining protein